MIAVGIIGYGTVGSGVYEVLCTNRETIKKRLGDTLEVKRICDLRDFPGDPAEMLITHEFRDIAEDEEIKVVVETMGGVRPAYDFVKTAIEHGKSVCTSNKELVVKHGAELIALAKEKGVSFLFEASVGGGIPIIRPINQCLTSEEIVEIKGILNGTTNYILTKMSREGAEYEQALREAQEKGYAERNPEADVEGYDACRKIAILTSLAYGKQVDYEDIYTEGISHISKDDMKYAKKLHAAIKLLGASKLENGRVYAQVSPVMLQEDHPLYGVNDVFNAIFVKGNMLDDVMFYGSGAGKLPTASAVVSDVIEAAKQVRTDIIWSQDKLELGSFKESVSRFFVRVSKEQREMVNKLFAPEKEVELGELPEEYAFFTGEMTEGEFEEKAGKISVLGRIRVAF